MLFSKIPTIKIKPHIAKAAKPKKSYLAKYKSIKSKSKVNAKKKTTISKKKKPVSKKKTTTKAVTKKTTAKKKKK